MISEAYAPSQHVTDGETRVFTFAFPFLLKADIACYLKTGEGIAAVAPETYGVEAAGESPDQGGILTFNAGQAPAAGELTIALDPMIAQNVGYGAKTSVDLPAMERSFDRGILIDLAAADRARRTLQVPPTDPAGLDMTLPSKAARAGAALAFDEDGKPVISNAKAEAEASAAAAAASAAGAAGHAEAAETAAENAEAWAASVGNPLPRDGSQSMTGNLSLGGFALADLNQSVSRAALGFGVTGDALATVATQAEARAAIGVARSFGWHDIRDYGAVAGGGDASAAIQAAIDAAEAVGGGVIYVPAGGYIAGGLEINGDNIAFKGDGPGASSIATSTAGKRVLAVRNCTRTVVSDLLIYNNTFTNSSAEVATLWYENTVQCHLLNCWVQGGWSAFAITGINAADTRVVRNSFTFAYGPDLVLLQRNGAGTHGAHRFSGNLHNQGWPVATPNAANFKGYWTTGTSYNTNDVAKVVHGGAEYYIQAATTGIAGAAAPSVTQGYFTNLNDIGILWRLVGRVDYTSLRIDTGVTISRFDGGDHTGCFSNGILISNSLGGQAPYAIWINDTESSGTRDNAVHVATGSEIYLTGLWLSQGVGPSSNGLIVSAGTEVNIKNCAAYGFANAMVLGQSSRRVRILGGQAIGSAYGVLVAANCYHFAIIGVSCGTSTRWGSSGTAIGVGSGASDRYVIAYNLVDGASTGISDGGSGSNKYVAHNY